MRSFAAALALCVLPSLAAAGPLSVGFSFGKTQDKVDANEDANGSLGVFARLALSPRISTQLEIERVTTPDQQAKVDCFDSPCGRAGMTNRRGTLLLVVDLGSAAAGHGRLVPMILAGYGIDRASDEWGGDTKGTHTEGGFALEYRAQGGFVIGGDLRLGGRSIEEQDQIQPLNGQIALYQPGGLQAGEYRSLRLYAAVRF